MRKNAEERAVARLAEIVALDCGIHPATARQIRTATALHDIGKLKIAGSILKKPGKLDEREFEIMKTHTTLGADMLSNIQGELGRMARNICRYHHEHWDGVHGYWGRRTDSLPLYVSIAAISDVFVALINERPYKTAWPPQAALEYIQKQAGTQFSPALVNRFLSLITHDKRIQAICN
jgi:HD-GYP domain-containing protein (c-di-GMP phosphodiesterase class II)